MKHRFFDMNHSFGYLVFMLNLLCRIRRLCCLPIKRFRKLSVRSTSIGHIFLHFPKDTHLSTSLSGLPVVFELEKVFVFG